MNLIKQLKILLSILIIGIVARALSGNILVSFVVSLVLYFVLDIVFKEKTSSTELESSGFVPLDDILDQFSGIIDAVERGDISLGTYLDLVNDVIISDEQMVEWKLDPFSLILFNDSAKLVSVENKKFKGRFRSRAVNE